MWGKKQSKDDSTATTTDILALVLIQLTKAKYCNMEILLCMCVGNVDS